MSMDRQALRSKVPFEAARIRGPVRRVVARNARRALM